MTTYTSVLSQLKDPFQKEYPLHYAILSGGKKTVKANLAKYSKHLNTPATSYNLTPLHVAVMSGNVNTVKLLLNQKVTKSVNPNIQDFHGWTPLHHAAVKCNDQILDLLVAAPNIDPEIKNHRGGTYRDLQRLIKPPVQEFALIKNSGDNEPHKVGLEELKQQLQGTLSQEILTPPEGLIRDWANKETHLLDWSEENLAHNDAYTAAYEKMRQSDPDIYLSKEHKNEKGKVIDYIGWGAFANRDFQEGEFIGEYIGEDTSTWEGWKESDYYLDGIDGNTPKHIFGHVTLTQTSNPNCEMRSVENVRGRAMRYILTAIEPIKKDEPLVWDYGSKHPVKYGAMKELRKSSLEAYFKDNSVDNLLQKLGEARTQSTDFQSYAYMISTNPELNQAFNKFFYIASTPKALFHLFFKGLLTIKSLLGIARLAKDSILADLIKMGLLQNFAYYLTLPEATEGPKLTKQIVQSKMKECLRAGKVQLAFNIMGNLGTCKDQKSFDEMVEILSAQLTTAV